MTWYQYCGQSSEPNMETIQGFVKTPLFTELCKYIEEAYEVTPQLSYSSCSMQAGWNVKYKKGGKSLCVLYPMEGLFIALVVVGEKEMPMAEFEMLTCCPYIQELFKNTNYYNGTKWLMIEMRDEQCLEDTKKLIRLRRTPKN